MGKFRTPGKKGDEYSLTRKEVVVEHVKKEATIKGTDGMGNRIWDIPAEEVSKE